MPSMHTVHPSWLGLQESVCRVQAWLMLLLILLIWLGLTS